ncbi:hypothetical protein RRG08_000502 [Elysia crispata]|uniref:Uncharacterized protein n=1 Tax=Elysia crispata TaxID=231223 RepID=A0AAE1CWA0_9GAST|nr:hypothetical protein RRG08_000502 [Elysia crispata]
MLESCPQCHPRVTQNANEACAVSLTVSNGGEPWREGAITPARFANKSRASPGCVLLFTPSLCDVSGRCIVFLGVSRWT